MTTTKHSDSIDAAGVRTPFGCLQTISKMRHCLSEKPLFLQIGMLSPDTSSWKRLVSSGYFASWRRYLHCSGP